MNSNITAKSGIYQAIGYTLILVILAFPFGLLGMQLLNYFLGDLVG
jgi:hypothetical protein